MQGKCTACHVAYKWEGAPAFSSAHCPRCRGKLAGTSFILNWPWLDERPLSGAAEALPPKQKEDRPVPDFATPGGELVTGSCPVCHAKVENDYGVVACSDHREQVKKGRRGRNDKD